MIIITVIGGCVFAASFIVSLKMSYLSARKTNRMLLYLWNIISLISIFKTREHYSRAVHGIMSAFQRSDGFLAPLVGKTYPLPTLHLEAGEILAKLYTI